MRSYGITSKMVRVEEMVIDGCETSDWFNINSGVKQCCVM